MIFEFEGDAFNAAMVAAIFREENEVQIIVWQQGNPVAYVFDDAKAAAAKHREVVEKWKAAAK
jgi:hypothetical protein